MVDGAFEEPACGSLVAVHRWVEAHRFVQMAVGPGQEAADEEGPEECRKQRVAEVDWPAPAGTGSIAGS